MKKLILLAALVVFFTEAFSQNTGYLGRHVILKTDLVNGKRRPFTNLDLEVVATRNLAFTASFRSFSYAGTSGPKETEDPSLIYLQKYYTDINNYISHPYKKYNTVFPGKTTGKFATVGLKYYLNKILPAPLGLYSGLEAGYGSAELNYDYHLIYRPYIHDAYFDLSAISEGRKNQITNTNFFFLSVPAIGYQTVVFRRLLIDVKFSLDTYYSDLQEEFLEEYPYPYISSNLGAGNIGRTTTGVSIYGKVGLLIF